MLDSGGTDAALKLARPLIDRAEAADGTPPVSDQALLAVSQGQRKMVVFAEHGVGVVDPAGTAPQATLPVAIGIIGQGELDLVVDPGARGRGIGTTALARLLEQTNGEVLTWAHGDNPEANDLLERAGFTPVRSLYRMALDPTFLPEGDTDPFAVEFPEGFELRTYGTDPLDDEAWVRTNAIAFADHPEQGRVTVADFALMRAEPWFDAADLFLLEAPENGGGTAAAPAKLAGSTWVKTLRGGDSADADSGGGAATETELYAIGVDPAYAGKGLGRALLEVTLARMAQHSPDRVTLYVDGENERAVNLYLAAGFTVDSRSQQWRRVPE